MGHKSLRLSYQAERAAFSGERVGGVGWVRAVVERWEVGGTNVSLQQSPQKAGCPTSGQMSAELGGRTAQGPGHWPLVTPAWAQPEGPAKKEKWLWRDVQMSCAPASFLKWTRWAQMCTCGTGNLVLHALLSCRRRRPEDLVGLCKLVAVLISLFFFSSIVTQCSCFFCLFFVGFFFNMRKRLLMAAMIFMVRSPGWCHGWSASGVCLHSSALLSKTWARLCCWEWTQVWKKPENFFCEQEPRCWWLSFWLACSLRCGRNAW